jgi:hypothetical protein
MAMFPIFAHFFYYLSTLQNTSNTNILYPNPAAKMQFKTTALLFALLIASSLASHEATLPQLRREKRVVEKSLSNSLGWLFSKRDECGTQYGPTYVNCGPRGCYQPSLGQVCCGSESGVLFTPVLCIIDR